ncbi:Eukaryotic translation initiation factor 4E type, putative [Perkinsus marinus ATCC 50983]|uniref:Eukaryotic translation initiation factor 4E type, putative n=1 Tax=Perkinsus marinus (strain ATCC 50983 / TXsc) TaxID=423536 RepID=C5M187_PERM5|nr:Eukaryotic translation initiation factor 4E type, putative [Perkinsus marinus ATCC 50983]EEQ97317.1 Eukaryotic translation initiation factor 4E type, putative [Perkinsus marinus ATCC 50983]|eukprot:XP_002764600.1 Eukaryotic translation initiation factor 4E type, putative [Perkinsus marinus ATCC 50983]
MDALHPEEARVKEGEYPSNEHPLETAWTFWFDRKSGDRRESDAYVEGLKQAGTFNTVEGFYRHYSHCVRPNELPPNVNVHLFRKGYKPMWEEFPDGGCWILRIKKKSARNHLGQLWETLVMACIGELFEVPDVVGCVLSTRYKDDIISIWNYSNATNPQVRFRICEKFREILGLNLSTVVQYKEHMGSMQDGSTYRNARSYTFSVTPTTEPADAAALASGLSDQILPPAATGEHAAAPAEGESNKDEQK